jgi:hypothetical protein
VIRYSQTQLTGSCGVGLAYGYYTPWSGALYPTGSILDENKSMYCGGTDYHMAAFVRETESKAVFEQFKKDYKIVFMSEKRRNRNSGRMFFFCVYDRSKAPADCNELNKDFKWPFRGV